MVGLVSANSLRGNSSDSETNVPGTTHCARAAAACLHTCVRASVRACVRACVHACAHLCSCRSDFARVCWRARGRVRVGACERLCGVQLALPPVLAVLHEDGDGNGDPDLPRTAASAPQGRRVRAPDPIGLGGTPSANELSTFRYEAHLETGKAHHQNGAADGDADYHRRGAVGSGGLGVRVGRRRLRGRRRIRQRREQPARAGEIGDALRRGPQREGTLEGDDRDSKSARGVCLCASPFA